MGMGVPILVGPQNFMTPVPAGYPLRYPLANAYLSPEGEGGTGTPHGSNLQHHSPPVFIGSSRKRPRHRLVLHCTATLCSLAAPTRFLVPGLQTGGSEVFVKAVQISCPAPSGLLQ